jgi:hypothetical protein
MRDITLDRDGEWLVVVITRPRRDREPKVSRTYLGRDEAAIVIELLRSELGTVTVRKVE